MKLPKSQGFSLIEIILVVLVTGFIVLLIANLPNSLGLVGSSKRERIAKEIVLKKIEDTRNLTYGNLANGASTISDPRLSQLPTSTGEMDIIDCPSAICASGELAKQVKVKVSWLEKGNLQKVEVTTIISKGGLQ